MAAISIQPIENAPEGEGMKLITGVEEWIRMQVCNSAMISLEREIELATSWQTDGDIKARNQLVLSHQRLIGKMASRFSGTGVEFSDLFNEGILGLISAADKFDMSRGCRFSTYASWWALSRMQELIHQSVFAVKVGNTRRERKAIRLLKQVGTLKGSDGADAIMKYAAGSSDASLVTLERIRGAVASRFLSLDMPVKSDVGEECMLTLGEIIEDSRSASKFPEDRVLGRDRRKLLEKCISLLADERSRQIVRARWLSAETPSYDQIGGDIGLSGERIRQIEKKALVELRKTLEGINVDMADFLI